MDPTLFTNLVSHLIVTCVTVVQTKFQAEKQEKKKQQQQHGKNLPLIDRFIRIGFIFTYLQSV